MPLQRFLLFLTLFFLTFSLFAQDNAALRLEVDEYLRDLQGRYSKILPNAAQLAMQRLRAEKEVVPSQKLRTLELVQALGNYENSADWLILASHWQSTQTTAKAGLYAAYLALRKASLPEAQALAWKSIGQWYFLNEDDALAKEAWEKSLALADDPELQSRLKTATPLLLEGQSPRQDGERAGMCFRFNQRLDKNLSADYFTITPTLDMAFRVQKQELCLFGLAYNTDYQVTFKAGLPGKAGVLPAEQTEKVRLDDKPPLLQFPSNAYILPQVGHQGVPLTVVNAPKVYLRIFRLDARALQGKINQQALREKIYSYEQEQLENQDGELVFNGEMAVEAAANVAKTMLLPVNDFLKDKPAGLYAITASSKPYDPNDYYWEVEASLWFLRSDLGLTTLEADNGLWVQVRSLETAQPIANAEVLLLASNNTVLGRLTTSQQGEVRFPKALLNGVGGMAAASVQVFSQQDFNFLDRQRPAFDFSDRGVTGRSALGAKEAFLYSERGVYRPKETVHLTALLRDSKGTALSEPLTLRLLRPDGVKEQEWYRTPNAFGALAESFALSATAARGRWQVKAYLDPNAQAIGEYSFFVQDYVPERLKVESRPTLREVVKGQFFALDNHVSADYLYGAPAANLTVQGLLSLKVNPKPFPAFADYQFGLIQETFRHDQGPVEVSATTDAQGQALLAFNAVSVPDTSLPLLAKVETTVLETSGEANRRQAELPLLLQARFIGVKARFAERVAEGQAAEFDVVWLNDQGAFAEDTTLSYELYAEDYRYQWFHDGERWNYDRSVVDRVIDSGTLAVRGGKALFSQAFPWGNYRLELFDEESNAASSLRFYSGWGSAFAADAAPTTLTLVPEQKLLPAGQNLVLHVDAPFAGAAQLIVANREILQSRPLSLTAGKNRLEIPYDDRFNNGTYVLLALYQPANADNAFLSARAIGVLPILLDQSAKTFVLTLTHPDVARPEETLRIQVQADVSQKVQLTVAAVDSGILQLTQFVSPNPFAFFFGQQRLGLDWRDVYGRLLDGRNGELATLRFGSGAESAVANADIIKPVALFSGLVETDANGKAEIAFPLPVFNGELRLMAVAFDDKRLTSAESTLKVRDPVVTQATLPLFLAPGDQSRLHLRVDNVEGAAGDYQFVLTTEKSEVLKLSQEKQMVNLKEGEQKLLTWSLNALEPGLSTLTLTMTTPEGRSQSQDWRFPVRSPFAFMHKKDTQTLNAGGKFVLDNKKLQTLLASFYPGQATLTLQLTAIPSVDVSALVRSLNLYPYGCTEQTISSAYPLLFYPSLATRFDIERAEAKGLETRVQEALQRVLDAQDREGYFATWVNGYRGNSWLTVYAADFLLTAKEKGYALPMHRLEAALKAVRSISNNRYVDSTSARAVAYAFALLSRVGQAHLPDVRYFFAEQRQHLGVLDYAYLALTFANYGDMARRDEAVLLLLQKLSADDQPWEVDYGSRLRDLAAATTLLAEAKISRNDLFTLWNAAVDQYQRQSYLSTQEQRWLLSAAAAILALDAPYRFAVDGEVFENFQGAFRRSFTAKEAIKAFTLENLGSTPLVLEIGSSGYPKTAPKIPADGFAAFEKQYFQPNGQVADLSKVKVGDLLVVLISGNVTEKRQYQALLADLLPAGLRIENGNLGGSSVETFAWLGELTTDFSQMELRDDRFVLAFNPDGDYQQTFRYAYLARALTPGKYLVPPALLEDMYRPQFQARTQPLTLTIQP
jgi:uncharacterized protein YfaS (alpha-2-macroglobulin family)